MSRRGGATVGPRGMPARPFARVDESAMQAKLQELKVAMAREKVARTPRAGSWRLAGGACGVVRASPSRAPRPSRRRAEAARALRGGAREDPARPGALRGEGARGAPGGGDRGTRAEPLRTAPRPAPSPRSRPPPPPEPPRRDPAPRDPAPSTRARATELRGALAPRSPAIEHVVIRAPSSVYAPPAGPRRAPPPGAHAPPLERPQPRAPPRRPRGRRARRPPGDRGAPRRPSDRTWRPATKTTKTAR